MGGYLLLPDDERELVDYLTRTLGMSLLLDDLAPRRFITGPRVPHTAQRPLEAIPTDLPRRPLMPTDVYSFLFWRPDLGSLIGFADKGRPDDPKSRVGFQLSTAGERDWRDRIDQDRSPLIRYQRSAWREEGHLSPGLLQGMAEITRLWPSALVTLHASIERWMRKGALKIDAFDYCDHRPTPLPRNRAAFVVWARPEAADWLASGVGRVWPWTA